MAVSEDDDVTGDRAVRQMEDRIREPQRQPGRKALDAEILKAALDKSRTRKLTWRVRSQPKGGFPPLGQRMSGAAETLGVSRSNPHIRVTGSAKPRRRYHQAQDGERRRPVGAVNLVPLITALAAARPIYGSHRITVIRSLDHHIIGCRDQVSCFQNAPLGILLRNTLPGSG